MKKLMFVLCVALLVPQYGALAHQENHVHSQWVKQELSQLRQTIQQLKSRIERLQGGGAQLFVGGQRAIGGSALNEVCGPNQQKLCSKSCAPGSKIDKASRGGNRQYRRNLPLMTILLELVAAIMIE